ncbi:MFS peptide transporter [Dichotomopilus funicola]|uniref:MFS peptide transporter n=1 Tax=Dichotomopilus funicola TaxID=1934379 RepID=A0AAN6ZJP1_9PEZI|nr:MFS peptide transporter [Dichotomopilus funicola]
MSASEIGKHGGIDEHVTAVSPSSSSSSAAGIAALDDGLPPTEEEKRTLRRVSDVVPKSAFIVAVVELFERFAYYGANSLFQNYVSTAYGLGQPRTTATALSTLSNFFMYVTAIIGAVVADQYLGRFRAIVLFAGIYSIGLLILWTTALPSTMEAVSANGRLAAFVVALLTIGLGTGGIKSNVAPMIGDQYAHREMVTKIDVKTGQKVIVDPAVTYNRIYTIYYGCIEVGSLSGLATPFMEKRYGFWAPFLLTWCVLCVAVSIFVAGRKTYVVRKPQGSVILHAFQALGQIIRHRNLDAAKPSWRAAHGLTSKLVPWNDQFVSDVQQTLNACKVFAFYPVIWVCYSQLSSNLVSQAAMMQGHGVPNDFMRSLETVSILVFLPIIDRIVMPLLRRRGIVLRPVKRIAIGFATIGLGMAYAAIVQHLIYSAPPCFEHPLACAAAQQPDGTVLPNNVHIAIQTPLYVLFGIASIFLNTTGPEFAYTHSPPQLKSFVQSLYLLTVAIGSALALALVPVSVDPKVLWMYVGVAIAVFVIGTVMYTTLRHLDKEEDALYEDKVSEEGQERS